MKKSDNKSGLSESFIAGVIAIVFLIVGYQTALFVHRAAVMKIVADRDAPDTVYVYGGSNYAQGSEPKDVGPNEIYGELEKDSEKESASGSEVFV